MQIVCGVFQFMKYKSYNDYSLYSICYVMRNNWEINVTETLHINITYDTNNSVLFSKL